MKNPITKLKVNHIYFQEGEIGKLNPSYLLLRESDPTAELKLYKIKGADRGEMPNVFAVTDKDKNTYNIVAYEPITIGGSDSSNEVA